MRTRSAGCGSRKEVRVLLAHQRGRGTQTRDLLKPLNPHAKEGFCGGGKTQAHLLRQGIAFREDDLFGQLRLSIPCGICILQPRVVSARLLLVARQELS
jgi:hypothetical protein